ncbi:MAG TPA: hypothetical protein VFK78_04015 [Gemmatimonadales bacterium]|nr:hypothetical protein [Gemmatimonadales bacterium]
MHSVLMVVLSLVAGFGARERAPAPGFKVIVNADNPVGMLSPDAVAKLFLRKQVVWEWNAAKPVLPAELAEGSPVREAFLREILRKDAASLKSYWQQMIFEGKAVPPPAFDSDQGVIDYVRKYPSAIGYVSASAALPADLKPVTITN